MQFGKKKHMEVYSVESNRIKDGKKKKKKKGHILEGTHPLALLSGIQPSGVAINRWEKTK